MCKDKLCAMFLWPGLAKEKGEAGSFAGIQVHHDVDGSHDNLHGNKDDDWEPKGSRSNLCQAEGKMVVTYLSILAFHHGHGLAGP